MSDKKEDGKDVESAGAASEAPEAGAAGAPVERLVSQEDQAAEDELLKQQRAEMTFLSSEQREAVSLVLKSPFPAYDDKKPFCMSRDVPFLVPQSLPSADYTKWELPAEAAPVVPEPAQGLEPSEFDVKAYNRARAAAPFVRFVPSAAMEQFSRPLATPEQVPLAMRVTSYQQMFQTRPETVQMIFLENYTLEGSFRKQFAQQLAFFSRAEFVILRNLGLSRVEDLHVAGVRYLDLSYNQLNDPHRLSKFLQRCQYLLHVIVLYNPLCSVEGWESILLAGNPYLLTINGKKVTYDDRVSAVSEHAKELKGKLGYMKWDWVLSSGILETGQRWDPLKLTRLTLSGLGLSEFHVGTFSNLGLLDLSDNPITTLRGCGLEQLERLAEVNFTNTQLSVPDDLVPLAQVPSLLRVTMKGVRIEGYRRRLIFECISLRGTNRSLGLQEVDGTAVTLEEKMDALRRHGRLQPAQLDAIHWTYCLVEALGHAQLRVVADFARNVTRLVLPGHHLAFADVSYLPGLVVLDLHGNDLKSVEGMARLTELRYLDLSGNVSLKPDSVLRQLVQLPKIESLSLIGNMNAYDNPSQSLNEYRTSVMGALVRGCRRLMHLDQRPVTVAERVEGFGAKKGVAREDVERFAFHLAIVTGLMTPEFAKSVSFLPVDVVPGKQYDPATVEEIRADGLGISNAVVDLRPFKALRNLDLSGNRLTDISSIGLTSCRNLRVLDVHDNRITTIPEEIGAFLKSFEFLESLAIRGNPCVSKSSDRSRLIGAIECMRSVTCNFRVIDTVVTTSERVAGWKRSGAGVTDDQVEELRWKATLYQRTPRDIPLAQLTELDLGNAELKVMDLSELTSLEVLSVRGNRLSTWEKTGIEKLTKLRALDARDNEFRSADDLAFATKVLPSLQAFGVSGNRFGGKSLREEVIKAIPRLREVQCSLSVLDETPIEVDELVAAFSKLGRGARLKGDVEQFRFDAVLFRRTRRGVDYSSVEALDLSEASLTTVSFASMTSLKKLSLRGNRLKSKAIATSGLDKLPGLTALDLRNNLIGDMRPVTLIADSVVTLEMLFIEGNPGYDSVSNLEHVRRTRFLSRVTNVSSVGTRFTVLNGRIISPHERCLALAGQQAPDEIERLRVAFVIHELGEKAFLPAVSLESQRLAVLDGIERLQGITRLDVSCNRLGSIANTLRFLPALETLSLRENALPSFETGILPELAMCHSLKVLYLHHAGPELKDVKSYGSFVFSRLRGLTYLDDVQNPFPLTPDQDMAIRFLHAHFQIGPNSTTFIDLRNRDISGHAFYAIVMALSALVTCTNPGTVDELPQFNGPKTVMLLEGNFKDYPVAEYRFLMIFKLPTLTMLDGVDISLDERANAEKQMRGILCDKKGGQDKLTLQAVRIAERATGLAGLGLAASAAGASGDDADAIDYEYVSSNAGSLKSIVDLKGAMAASSAAVESTGTLLSKIEVVIMFLQIFAVIVAIDNVDWPDDWLKIVKFTLAFNINIEAFWPDMSLTSIYIKFAVMMLVPMILGLLYAFNFNKERWWDSYVTHWTWARFKFIVYWVLLMILAVVIGVAFDPASFEEVKSGQIPSSETTRSVILWLWGSVTLFVFILWRIAKNFRKHKDDDEYWMRVYTRYRRRLSLFFVTVLYMPLARLILMTYRCKGLTLELYSDQSCPSHFEVLDYPAMVWVGFGFALLYVLGIPIFFGYLVFRGVREVEANYGFRMDDQQLKDLKAALKKDKHNANLQHQLAERQRAVQNKYANAVNSWKSASSYLYSAYRRSNRFQKIVQMTLKLLLLSVALYVGYGAMQPLAASILLAVFWVWNLLRRPYSDHMEDIMDSISQLTNVVNAVVGYLISSDQWPTDSVTPTEVLSAVNGFNVLQIILNFFIYPCRMCLSNRHLATERKRALDRSINEARSRQKSSDSSDKKGGEDASGSAGDAESGGGSGGPSVPDVGAAADIVSGAAEVGAGGVEALSDLASAAGGAISEGASAVGEAASDVVGGAAAAAPNGVSSAADSAEAAGAAVSSAAADAAEVVVENVAAVADAVESGVAAAVAAATEAAPVVAAAAQDGAASVAEAAQDAASVASGAGADGAAAASEVGQSAVPAVSAAAQDGGEALAGAAEETAPAVAAVAENVADAVADVAAEVPSVAAVAAAAVGTGVGAVVGAASDATGVGVEDYGSGSSGPSVPIPGGGHAVGDQSGVGEGSDEGGRRSGASSPAASGGVVDLNMSDDDEPL